MNPTINPLEFISLILKVPCRNLKQESQWYNSLDVHQKQELQDPLLLLPSPRDDATMSSTSKATVTCNTALIQSIQSLLLQEKEVPGDDLLLAILRDKLQQGDTSFSSSLSFLFSSSSCKGWHSIKVLVSTRLVTVLIHLTLKVSSCAPMAGTILHNLTQSILSSIRSLSSCDDTLDENGECDVESVYHTAAFYQSMLLHVMEPIVGMNVVCATLWRDMAEISVVILSSLSTLTRLGLNWEETYVSNQQEFVLDAIDRILTLIRQGLHALIVTSGSVTAVTANAVAVDGQGNVAKNKSDKMGKLLKFFFLRLMQFIPLVDLKRRNGGRLTRYLSCMVECKGMLWAKGGLVVGQEVGLLLRGKLDLCLEKFLECRATAEESNDMTCGFYESTTLRLLLRGNSLNVSQGEDSSDGFWIGKWCALLDLLMDMTRRMVVRGKATTTKVALTIREWEDIEFVCETMLWQTIPMCHDMVTTGDDLKELVSKTLDVIGSLFLVVERMTLGREHCKCCRRLHHLLHRWMGCFTTRDGQVHPLTYELVLAVVQVYTIQSFVQSQNNTCVNSKNGTSTVYSKGFVRMTSRLLFDARISRMHRKNIGIVLLRIMGSSSSMLQPLKHCVELSLVHSLIRFLENVKQDPSPSCHKKRKRSATIKWQSMISLIDISPLVHCIFSKNLFWSKLNLSTRKKLVDDFSDLLLVGHDNLERKLKRIRFLMTRTPDLLYIVCMFLVKARGNEPSSKGNELLDILLLALSQEQVVERGNIIVLCRLVHCFISETNNMTPRQQMLYMNAMSSLSCAKSSMRSKFGAALLSTVLHCALVSNGTLASVSSSIQTPFFTCHDTADRQRSFLHAW